MDERIREKIRKSLQGHGVSEETRELIRKSLQGRKKTKLHRKKIALSMKRYWKIRKLNTL